MKNVIIKAILMMLISVSLIINIPSYSNADFWDDGKAFLNGGSGSAPIDTNKLGGISNMISDVLLGIAIAVTGISAIIMSINFIIQSVEDKAKIKESMVPWIIGIIISFGAYGIWKIVISVMKSAFS